MVSKKRREALAEKDRMALLSSLNNARGLEGCEALECDPLLYHDLQGRLATTEDMAEGGGPLTHLNMHTQHLQASIMTPLPSEQLRVKVMSR